jgi:hypothetical protein
MLKRKSIKSANKKLRRLSRRFFRWTRRARKKRPPEKSAEKKKKKRGLFLIFVDTFVALLCLAGMAAGLYLFWKDFNGTLTKQSEQPIATITFKERAAQRRFEDRVIWDRLQTESPVYNGDTIRTAEISEATVTFANGDTIDLRELTLVQIYTDESGNHIDLGGGNVNASSKGSLVLSFGGNDVTVSDGGVVSANTGEAGMGLQILEGMVQVSTANGVQELTAGDAVSVRNDGTTEALRRVSVLSPLPNQRLVNRVAGPMNVPFSWAGSNLPQWESVIVEIAADQRFTTVTKTLTGAPTARETVSLPLGIWWYRAFPTTNGNRPSAEELAANASIGKFTVMEGALLTLVAPENNAVLGYFNRRPAVRFQWKARSDVLRYVLEIADNPQIAGQHVTEEIDGQTKAAEGMVSVTVSNLADGLWYWRVRPVFAAEITDDLSSVTASFSIQRTASLAAPVLASPAAGVWITTARNRDAQYFSWQRDREAASYTFVVSASPDLSSPVITENLLTTTFSYQPEDTRLRQARYYWGVSAVSSGGESSPVSEIRPFTASPLPPPPPPGAPVTLEYPANGAAIDGLAAYRSPVVFRWSYTDVPATARFVLSRNANPLAGTPIAQVTNPPANIPVNRLGEGTYFWTITGATAGGNNINADRVFSFRVLPVEIGRVELRSPPEGADIPGLIARDEPEAVQWATAENLRSSRFVLSDNPNPLAGRPLMDVSNPGRSLRLIPLAAGTYYWTVQAETADGLNISASAPFSFRVLPVPLLPAPAGLTPVDNYVFGPEQLRTNRSIAFHWSPVEGAAAYIFQLFQVTGTERRLLGRSDPLRGTSQVLDNLNVLDRGVFLWQVEAVALRPDGSVSQHGEPAEADFMIDIPALPRVQGLDTGELYGQ